MERLADRLVSWASILEPNTREQAEKTAAMPFIHPHVALMPDAHLGMGATVGSVIPTLGAIIPAAVGVDIGCGMTAVQTQWELRDLEGLDRAKLRKSIEHAIPLDKGNYNQRLTAPAEKRVAELADDAAASGFNAGDYALNWMLQLGSLGSGNHFIEVTADENKQVWLFLHSGSRGIGNKIATHHIKVARKLCDKWWIRLPDPDLAYLVEGTDEFWAYIRELRWAQKFAAFNRAEMMDRLIGCFEEWIDNCVDQHERIDCHHNYTVRENHYGRNVWVSRKGAIAAYEGWLGLIPGSMGAASYVVEGRGYPPALSSAPHGAGRVLSRRQAKNTLTKDSLAEAMQDIEYNRSADLRDEHPDAYKPIDQVMQDADSLVEVRHTLRQIVNVKGE